MGGKGGVGRFESRGRERGGGGGYGAWRVSLREREGGRLEM